MNILHEEWQRLLLNRVCVCYAEQWKEQIHHGDKQNFRRKLLEGVARHGSPIHKYFSLDDA